MDVQEEISTQQQQELNRSKIESSAKFEKEEDEEEEEKKSNTNEKQKGSPERTNQPFRTPERSKIIEVWNFWKEKKNKKYIKILPFRTLHSRTQNNIDFSKCIVQS